MIASAVKVSWGQSAPGIAAEKACISFQPVSMCVKDSCFMSATNASVLRPPGVVVKPS